MFGWLQLKTLSDVARYRRQQRKEVIRYPKEKIADADVRRQLERFSRLGPDGLSEEKYARVSGVYSILLGYLYIYPWGYSHLKGYAQQSYFGLSQLVKNLSFEWTRWVLQLSAPYFLEIFRAARRWYRKIPRPQTCRRNPFSLPEEPSSSNNFFQNKI